jgi:hypothetical protein
MKWFTRFLLIGIIVLTQIVSASEKPPRYIDILGSQGIKPVSPDKYQPSTTLTSYLSEDFEGETFPPTGWAAVITNYDFTWSQIDSYFGVITPYSGNYMACVDWDHNQQERLITPTLDFSAASTDLYLGFSWMANYEYMVYPSNNGNYELWISIDDGITWSDLLWAEDSVDTFEMPVWNRTTVYLSPYAGQSTVRLSWLYTGDDADAVFLDMVVVSDDSGSYPSNDNCADVTPVNLAAGAQLTLSGDNTNATNDCDTLEFSQVWESFTTSQCLDITIDFCGMPSAWGNAYGILVEECPCGNFIDYSWISTDSCGDGNFMIGFNSVPPGTYYYPVILDPTSSAVGAYTIHVNGGLCQGSGDCDYVIGDISGDNQRLGGDVTYGVRFFKGTGTAPRDSCYLDSTSTYLYVAGDCNGNCEFRGSDITRLVAYFKGTAVLRYCHYFPTSLPRLATKAVTISP